MGDDGDGLGLRLDDVAWFGLSLPGKLPFSPHAGSEVLAYRAGFRKTKLCDYSILSTER